MKIHLLQKLIDQNPNKIFLISQDKKISFKDFLILTSRIYNFLNKKPEKYIFINAEKNEYVIAAYLACAKLGKIASFIDPLSKNPESFYNLTNDSFYFSNELYEKIEHYDYTLINNANQVIHNEFSEIIFTTGTTGSPKGVLLSHRTVYETAYNINKFTNLNSDDIELHMMPISHSFGLARIRCSILKGNTTVLMNGFGNLISFYKNLEKYRATVISTVPAGVRFLLRLSKDKISNYSSQIKMIELGSSPMSTEEKVILTNLLPKTNICMHYGLTEASRSTFLNFKNERKFIDSVGKQNFGTDIKIFNKDGFECDVEDSGEICIKGSNLFSEYIFCDNKTAFNGEYFKTGDYGYVNKEGYLYFEGRKDEMLNISGKKVSPLEIEKHINEIKFIDESVCISFHNSRNGMTEIKAYVVLNKYAPNKKIENEIVNYLKKKIEYYKIPSKFVNIDVVPKSHNGKILRKKLEEN